MFSDATRDRVDSSPLGDKPVEIGRCNGYRSVLLSTAAVTQASPAVETVGQLVGRDREIGVFPSSTGGLVFAP